MSIKKLYLVGNPNCGKSSLFNKLTGLHQKIANYPGVTVEKKSGFLRACGGTVELTDLPGCYSLYPNSIDEKVVIEELLHHPPDLILFVADAGNMHRSLLLYTQVADLGYPIIMVLNMVDELTSKGYKIEIPLLESELGCSVFVCNSKKGEGIHNLEEHLLCSTDYSSKKAFANKTLFTDFFESEPFTYRHWHQYVNETPHNAIIENTKRNEIIDRYNTIERIINLTLTKTQKAFEQKALTDKLDRFLMHPLYGYLFILLILFLVFQTLFNVASLPMDGMDYLFGMLSSWLKNQSKNFLTEFIAEAVIPGLAGILIFIPQISLLFILNTILEESGYMARIVFLLDKLMRKFGLSGKSLLPLLSGNACAIPAIASTKALPTQKERIITILSIPFMTCSARLPVYTVLISLVIPTAWQGLTLLGLYALGGVSSIIFAYFLNRNLKTNEKSFLIMELPPYRFPSFTNIFNNVKNAVIPFVKTAGKFIFSISILLWFLASYGYQEKQLQRTPIEHSIAADMGKTIEPVIKPLGYDWKIGVALISSFAAREVVVSTLATLYKIEENVDNESTLIEKMRSEINPTTQKPVFTLATGLSLMIFYAFAMQCMSTLAAIYKETNDIKWPILSFSIMTTLAYICSFIVFQIFK